MKIKIFKNIFLFVITLFYFFSISDAADLRKGWEFYNIGKFKEAINEWKPLADLGDPDALFALATCYESGKGVSIDKEKAINLLLKASDKGHMDAKYNAALLINESDGKLALKLLEEVRLSQSAIVVTSSRYKGMVENTIGWIYLMGTGGVKKDYKKALYWGIEGGEKGATNAYSNVALQYFAGLGVEQNYDMMVSYLIKSLYNFKDGDDWILKEDDEWTKFKNKAPKKFWVARQIYWKYVLFKNPKYIKQLEKLIN